MEAVNTDQGSQLRQRTGKKKKHTRRVSILNNTPPETQLTTPLLDHQTPEAATALVPVNNQALNTYEHADAFMGNALRMANHSSLIRNYSARERRSFISKRSVLAALCFCVALYTVIFYSDTGVDWAARLVLEFSILAFAQKFIAYLYSVNQSWVNAGENILGSHQAGLAMAEYAADVVGLTEEHEKAILSHPDQSKSAKTARGFKAAGKAIATLGVTIPPALASGAMEENESFMTQFWTVVTSLPQLFFANNDLFTAVPEKYWLMILNRIDSNVKVLLNDLGSKDPKVVELANKKIRRLLDGLDAENKPANVILRLLHLHDDFVGNGEHLFIDQAKPSWRVEFAARAFGIFGAVMSQGSSYMSVYKLRDFFGIPSVIWKVAIGGVSMFSNGRLGYKGFKYAVEFFTSPQKQLHDVVPWYSESNSRLGRWTWNLLGFPLMWGLNYGGKVASLFSGGTAALSNLRTTDALRNFVGQFFTQPFSSATSSAFFGFFKTAFATGGYAGASAVNFVFYNFWIYSMIIAAKLYIIGTPREQRNVQSIEQMNLVVSKLKQMGKERTIEWMQQAPQEVREACIAIWAQEDGMTPGELQTVLTQIGWFEQLPAIIPVSQNYQTISEANYRSNLAEQSLEAQNNNNANGNFGRVANFFLPAAPLRTHIHVAAIPVPAARQPVDGQDAVEREPLDGAMDLLISGGASTPNSLRMSSQGRIN